ncbi:MAG: hypothetical protein WCG85_11950 [Polyangia bacterium]
MDRKGAKTTQPQLRPGGGARLTAEMCYQMARLSYEAGDFDSATVALNDALTAVPGHPQASALMEEVLHAARSRFLATLRERGRTLRHGRSYTIFASKRARIARVLLQTHDLSTSLGHLSITANVTRKSTNQIVKQMEKDGWLVRSLGGGVRARDPVRLLDALDHDHQFLRNEVMRGYMPSPSGPKLLTTLSKVLDDNSVPYAATGLASAWLLTEFGPFSLVTLYLRKRPSTDFTDMLETRHELSFQYGDAAANVWFVIPENDWVFESAFDRDGVRTVHPLQVYLDLAAHPENAGVARELIRNRFLTQVMRPVQCLDASVDPSAAIEPPALE